MKIELAILLFSTCFLFSSFAAHAHGGGLNKDGCHNNRKTGDYHCHRGNKSTPRFRSPKPLPVFSGIPKIVDGDTIRIEQIRIRFHGIDAPEARQTCTVDGREWRCGYEATKALTNIIAGRSVSCVQRDRDRYGRIVAGFY
jgi:endonuclease YncB( thermonuclease family)